MIASFVDKVIIYILGIVTVILGYNSENLVAYILIGAIMLGVSECFSENKKWQIEFVVYIAYLLLGSVYPQIIVFTGIGMYSMVYKFGNRRGVFVTYMITTILFLIYPMIRLDLLQNVVVCISIVLTIIIGKKTYLLASANSKIKKLRDDGIEVEQTLKERNNYLLQNQEKEIHIATLNERNRIAREIHDNVGHMLSRSILQLGAIMAVEKNETTKMMLAPLKNTLDDAMSSIRESVHDLHKDSFDLKEAVKSLLEELSAYEVTFEYDMSSETEKDVKYSFITILKEAVTNIIKHSNANKVDIIMRELDNYYQMVIEDNGVVEKDINNVDAGIGLTNMEERIKKMSGFISFSTVNGFRIFVSIPKDRKK